MPSQPTPRVAAVFGELRAVSGADGERMIEGRAVPYGETITLPNGRTETMAPGAFAQQVRELAGQPIPYLDRHGVLGGVPVASVVLRESDDGLYFRGAVLDVPESDAFYTRAQAGLLGSSVEFLPRGGARGMRVRGADVTIVNARTYAIAGAYAPAYMGATLTARAEGGSMDTQDETTETTEAEDRSVAPATASVAPSAREIGAEVAAAIRAELPTAHSPITQTGVGEPTYRRGEGHSYLRDTIALGLPGMFSVAGAGERVHRHGAQVRDLIAQMADREGVIVWDRAGEALTTETLGMIPTEIMGALVVPRLLKGRPLGAFIDNVGITDARPRTLARVTTSTSVAAQSSEGANPAASDFASEAITVTPALVGGSITVSRQVIDGNDPSAEALIMADLREAYMQYSEDAIEAAVQTGANSGSATGDDDAVDAGVRASVIEYMTDYFLPAEGVFLSSDLYAAGAAELASDGRPVWPWINPTNASGAQTEVGAGGFSSMGVPIYHEWAASTRKAWVGRRNDHVVYESALAEFRVELDSTVTPANIKLGVWAYIAVAKRRGGNKYTYST